MEKRTLSNTSEADTRANVSDVKIVGNSDGWSLLAKASSKAQGWMKSSKAYEIKDYGCIVQVTTQQGTNVAEALVFIPGTKVVDDTNGGRKVVKT